MSEPFSIWLIDDFTLHAAQKVVPADTCVLGWSEKHKSWKMQQFKADSELRHSNDFRTIFGILFG